MEYEHFQCATLLSGVCHSWREVALQTSTLWTEVFVGSDTNAEYVRDFWVRTVRRVKSTAAHVRIHVVGRSEADVNALRECHLDHLPNIKKLELILETNEVSAFIPSAPLHWPVGRVDQLELSGSSKSSMDTQALRVINRCPNLRSLSITNAAQVELGFLFCFPRHNRIYH
jgi:hypothetical protein